MVCVEPKRLHLPAFVTRAPVLEQVQKTRIQAIRGRSIMKTIKRTISTVSAVALSALLLVPGCVGQESGDDTEAGDQVWSEAKEGQGIALKGTVVVSVTMYDEYNSDHGSHDGSDHSAGHRSHRSVVEYHLQRSPEDNEPLRLYFDGAPPSFETGDEISVAGTWQTQNDVHAIAVDDTLSIRKPSSVAQDGEIGQSSQEIVTVRAPKAHKIAVLLVGATTITAAQAQAQINAYTPGSAAAFIGENSGLVDTFQGNVFSYPSISTANCATDAQAAAIRTAALNAFQAAGNSLSNYTNIAYVIGAGNNCTFVANGTVNPPGGTSLGVSTYNNNFQNCTSVAHELGHNLGFYHAHSTACGSTKLYNASR
ncbi:MAG: M66 family metalloprotease, partial [Byssovorax sp.]